MSTSNYPCSTYNGWSNFETRQAYLHMTNDENAYEHIMHIFNKKCLRYHTWEVFKEEFEEFLREFFEGEFEWVLSCVPACFGTLLADDIFSSWVNAVEWEEIVETGFKDDFEEYQKEFTAKNAMIKDLLDESLDHVA